MEMSNMQQVVMNVTRIISNRIVDITSVNTPTPHRKCCFLNSGFLMSEIIMPAQMVPKIRPRLIATMLPNVIGVWGNVLTAFLKGSGCRTTSIADVSSKKHLAATSSIMIRRCEQRCIKIYMTYLATTLCTTFKA